MYQNFSSKHNFKPRTNSVGLYHLGKIRPAVISFWVFSLLFGCDWVMQRSENFTFIFNSVWVNFKLKKTPFAPKLYSFLMTLRTTFYVLCTQRNFHTKVHVISFRIPSTIHIEEFKKVFFTTRTNTYLGAAPNLCFVRYKKSRKTYKQKLRVLSTVALRVRCISLGDTFSMRRFLWIKTNFTFKHTLTDLTCYIKNG